MVGKVLNSGMCVINTWKEVLATKWYGIWRISRVWGYFILHYYEKSDAGTTNLSTTRHI